MCVTLSDLRFAQRTLGRSECCAFVAAGGNRYPDGACADIRRPRKTPEEKVASRVGHIHRNTLRAFRFTSSKNQPLSRSYGLK